MDPCSKSFSDNRDAQNNLTVDVFSSKFNRNLFAEDGAIQIEINLKPGS